MPGIGLDRFQPRGHDLHYLVVAVGNQLGQGGAHVFLVVRDQNAHRRRWQVFASQPRQFRDACSGHLFCSSSRDESSMTTSTVKGRYDVVILGAGHNGMVAAAYLGRAGLSVLLLEKNDYIGGATTSQKVFPDYDARLSRYSYLVSLFPEQIIRDLGLKL